MKTRVLSQAFLVIILLLGGIPAGRGEAFGLLSLSEASSSPLTAGTTFNVTKTADSSDGACDADCSLREAVIAANSQPDADVIALPAGIYVLTLPAAVLDSAETGDLDISAPVSIQGAAANTTIIDANHIDRVFQIDETATSVTLAGLTIRNGTSIEAGGGIWIVGKGGIVTLNQVMVRDNSASNGGGIAQPNGGELIINQSTIARNTTNGSGGGIQNYAGKVTLTNSTISANTATGGGGGGGIYSYFDFNDPSGTVINLTNSTVTANTSSAGGAGIINFVGTVNLSNSILAGNFGSDCAGAGGGYNSLGYNLVQNPGCSLAGITTGNILNQDPKLGPLMNNGGPTPTHALLPGSPAINTGSPAGSGSGACASVDQRNMQRPQEARCDIGAYERLLNGTIGGVVYNMVTRVPVPGVVVRLDYDHFGGAPSFEAVSDIYGEVSFLNVPPGQYQITPLPPSGWIGGGRIIQVATYDQSTYRLTLRKQIPLLYPLNGSSIELPETKLCWESLPQAIQYVLQVKDPSGALIANPNVYGNCYTLNAPLVAGATYKWSLAAALDANGESIGGSSTFEFTYRPGAVNVSIPPQTDGALISTDKSAEFAFPAGSFEETTSVTYQRTDQAPDGYPLSTLKAYEISAENSLAPDASYQVTIRYNPLELKPVNLSTLALYYWDPNQQLWIPEPTSQVDLVNRTVTASPSHFSLWAVMGETQWIYLPQIRR